MSIHYNNNVHISSTITITYKTFRMIKRNFVDRSPEIIS